MSNPVSPPQPTSSVPTSSVPTNSVPTNSGPTNAGSASPWPVRPSWPGAEIRIGDAERTDVADRLARHFSDGRLDEAEFGERLDRAMRAKTMSDLSVLLTDLPGEPTPPPQGSPRDPRSAGRAQQERERLALKAEQRAYRRAARQRRWRTLRMLVLLIAVVIGALATVHWLVNSVAVWLIIGVVAFLWLRRNAARSHHREHREPDDPRRY